MNSGSAVTLAVFRWDARGAAIAWEMVMPRSTRFTIVWRTVVMMVDPPGEPSARNGLSSFRMIVGDIDERGRFPGAMRFGSVGLGGLGAAGQSVSWWFGGKPRRGTTMPEPPVCSIVSVYSTTLPHLSETVRLVVEIFSVSFS